MCKRIAVIFCLTMMVNLSLTKYRRPVIKYPKDTLFWATDFFVKGCRNFLVDCPPTYKVQHICARSYNGEFRDFNNYCEMQYENCNTWRMQLWRGDFGCHLLNCDCDKKIVQVSNCSSKYNCKIWWRNPCMGNNCASGIN